MLSHIVIKQEVEALHRSYLKITVHNRGLYLVFSTFFKNILGLVLQIFLFLAAFECKKTSDWLNHAFKVTIFWTEIQRMLLRMVGE